MANSNSSLQMSSNRNPATKIMRLDELARWQLSLPGSARSVVTNGCFDILHAGHAVMLYQARSLGDYLVVGVNDDASVRRLKGPSRPYNDQQARALAVAALESVDAVVIFSGLTAQDVIRASYAAVWAKGGDYSKDTLHPLEVQAAQERGSDIVILPMSICVSTTALATKMEAGSGARGDTSVRIGDPAQVSSSSAGVGPAQ